MSCAIKEKEIVALLNLNNENVKYMKIIFIKPNYTSISMTGN